MGVELAKLTQCAACELVGLRGFEESEDVLVKNQGHVEV